MVLAIDAGNSQLKMAIFKNDVIKEKIIISYDESNFENTLKSWISKDINEIGLISVKEDFLKKKISDFSKKKLSVINLSYKFPFDINYSTPETLGIDRVVACAGAYALNERRGNILVIDAGTCVTYDVVNTEKQYIGGAISPGVDIRCKALNHYTAKLPMIKIETKHAQTIGNTTQESIVSGVLNGIKFEMQGYIDHMNSHIPGVKAFLTGGDSFFFEDEFKSSIFAEENLVLIGINELLKANA
jgi:type III pantothenate kinase